MRPFLFVLAGVNGSGKSSVGGALLREHGLDWFNPDSHARELMRLLGLSQEEANARAWGMGREALERAIARGTSHAFETTLGGATVTRLLMQATQTHAVKMWYCGLASPELHIERVASRVARGGHPIAEAKIRERWDSSRLNLLRLMPRLARLQVLDNSTTVAPGADIPDPLLVMDLEHGRQLNRPDPADPAALAAVPPWARPLVEAGIRLAATPPR